jgi:hypothetical protein
MKSIPLIMLLGLSAQALLAAEPNQNVTAAGKHLADKPNYSWTATTREADGSTGRIGPIEGKTEKAGLIYLSFTVGGGIPVEVYMNGQKGVAKALEGWQTFDEIAETSGAAAAIVRYLRAYKCPAAESADLAGKAKELKEAEGALSGDLKDDAVKDLLLRGGRRREGQEPQIADSKGSIKFWLTDGALTKYEMNVQGKVTTGDRENEVNRTTTIEIKDAGTTKLEMPDEVKQKLNGTSAPPAGEQPKKS